MPDPVAAPETGSTPTAEVTVTTPPPDLRSEVEKWKEMARKQEARAKENARAAERLAALEEANKSESQKAAETAAAALKRAEDAEARALRLEVAQAKGLSAAQAKRLQGSTREELDADADDLLETFKVPDPPTPPPGGKPIEHLRGGGDPTIPLNGDPLLQSLKSKLGI